LTKLRNIKEKMEERFHQKWTSLSVQYHFKAVASHLLDFPFSATNLHLDEEVSEEIENQFNQIIEELDTNRPLQYILGETVFRDCRILCEPAALIPRPETEELVELVLQTTDKFNSPKILDVCTGTGCIAIAIQQERPASIVLGLDKFDEVITLAKRNNVLNNMSVNFSTANVLKTEEIQKYEDGSYDVWISNPPYIPMRDKELMETNVLMFEPEAALFVSNEDPLLFYRVIAQSAQKGLKSGGFLFYEIHEDFGQETIDLLTQEKFENIQLHADLQGKNRMISAMKK
jgi:release factor glutamine methyltransferase